MYSYVDPVGSLIEVSYTMNTDKTDYKEERKVTKAYENSAAPDPITRTQVGKCTSLHNYFSIYISQSLGHCPSCQASLNLSVSLWQ